MTFEEIKKTLNEITFELSSVQMKVNTLNSVIEKLIKEDKLKKETSCNNGDSSFNCCKSKYIKENEDFISDTDNFLKFLADKGICISFLDKDSPDPSKCNSENPFDKIKFEKDEKCNSSSGEKFTPKEEKEYTKKFSHFDSKSSCKKPETKEGYYEDRLKNTSNYSEDENVYNVSGVLKLLKEICDQEENIDYFETDFEKFVNSTWKKDRKDK